MIGVITDADARVGIAQRIGHCRSRVSGHPIVIRRLLTAGSAVLVAQAMPARAADDLAVPLAAIPAGPAASPGALPAGPPDAIAPFPDRGCRDEAGLWEERQRHLDRLQNTVNGFELTYQLLNIADAAQTISCMRRVDCHEANPLFGSHPSAGTVVGIKAGMGVFHYLVYRLLGRDPKAAMRFEITSVLFQGTAVGLNLRHKF